MKKTSAWIRLVISSVLVVVFTGVLLIGCFGDGFDFGSNFSIGFFNSFQYSNSGAYTVGNGSFEADTLTDVEINWVSGAVTVIPTDGKEIEITENTSETQKDKDKLRYLYENGKLTIQYKKSAFSLISFSRLNKKLELRIPRRLISQLSNVTINNINSDVELSDLTTKTLYIDNVSGNIKGTNITASKKTDIETVSGDITMAGSMGSIASDTVSGDCTYNSGTTPEDIDIESVSGDIRVTLPDDAGFKVDYDTISGDFSCDFDTTHNGDSIIHGTGENSFTFDTVSGDVFLWKADK